MRANWQTYASKSMFCKEEIWKSCAKGQMRNFPNMPIELKHIIEDGGSAFHLSSTGPDHFMVEQMVTWLTNELTGYLNVCKNTPAPVVIHNSCQATSGEWVWFWQTHWALSVSIHISGIMYQWNLDVNHMIMCIAAPTYFKLSTNIDLLGTEACTMDLKGVIRNGSTFMSLIQKHSICWTSNQEA